MFSSGCEDTFPRNLNEDLGFDSLVFVKRAPPANAGTVLSRDGFRPGGNVFLLAPAAPGGNVVNLTGLESGDVSGIDVAPDGESVVAAIKTDVQDRFHLYRIEILAARQGEPCFGENGDIGPACTRLTFGPANDTRPIHLPDGRIGFLREDPLGPVDFQGRGRSRIFFAIEPNGGSAQRIDVGPGHAIGAGSLRDGNLQYTRWTQRNDGAVFLPFRQDALGVSGLQTDGGELSGVPLGPVQDAQGRLFAACTSQTGTWGSGTICQRDDHGDWQNVIPGIPSGNGCSPDGRIRDPFPLLDGRFLVSYATVPQGCLNIEDGDRGLTPDFSLAIVDPRDGARSPVFNDRTYADLDPRPVVKRSLLDEGVVLGPPPGGCGQEGVVIEGFAKNADGSLVTGASRVRVLEGLSGQIAPWWMKIGGRQNGAICASTGMTEVPVYPDGSYQLVAPARVPLKIQVLDRYGTAIRNDSAWRGGPPCSQRSCSGCHAGAVSATGFEQSQAYLSGAPPDLSDRAQQESIDFQRDIQPILERSCATTGCHDSTSAAGNYVTLGGSLLGLDLSGTPAGATTTAYRNLTMVDQAYDGQTGRLIEQRRPYVVPGSARESRLMQRLGVPCRYDCAGQAAWAPWGLGEGMTHPEDQPGWTGTLTNEDRWQLVEWIETGSSFLGRGATP